MKRTLLEVLIVLGLAMGIACTRVEYIDRPTPVPSPSPAPVVVVGCTSVPREKGDCYRTDEDVYLEAVEAAHEAAAQEPDLLYKGLIQGGQRYIGFIIDNLKGKGLCAGVYENEEVAVWALGAARSENWDLILEPGDGRIMPRRGPGAHDYTCSPPTTESGS
ncbi:MAG TPA: hypothetical protein VJA25_03595 [Dehalococcoidia bacterium]|nr:hypothetical protein [Dehalococcoidia bacterium]